MENRSESTIKAIYKKWKGLRKAQPSAHPDEESLACFLENKLPRKEHNDLQAHLLACEQCAKFVAADLRISSGVSGEVPEELLVKAKELVLLSDLQGVLEICLRVKDKALEVIKSTGDILMGQELVPAPVLRSRNLKDFKDEITVVKDFKDMRVKVRVESKKEGAFSLYINVNEKATRKAIKDLRITLLKHKTELESYVAESGKACFENVALGKYTIAINDIEQAIASVLVDINI